MSQATEAPPIPDGDPDEWGDAETAALFRYVAGLGLGENVTRYLEGQADTLESREEA